jgi:transcriptional regulator with XRE-family HTH domain
MRLDFRHVKPHSVFMTLSQWRKSLKKTQAEVASMLDTDQGTYSHWERGARSPALDAVAKIVDVSKGAVTLADLVRTSERG